ncbi:MAG: OmpA family protein [Saprospiraceae bacterium]|nr:OmpA family protein [Saprospiraceae bacterium]
MSRRNTKYAIITAILLIFWLIGGVLYSETFLNQHTLEDVNLEDIPGKMLIEDKDDFRLELDKAILFSKNEADPILIPIVTESLMKVIKYVKSNPLKRITIIGLYTINEVGGEQLAKSRADSIYKLFKNVGTPDYQLKIQTGRKDDLLKHENKNIVVGAVDFIFSCIAPFEVNDHSNKFHIQTNNNLVFKHSSASFLMNKPSQSLTRTLKLLVSYINNHPKRKIILSGYNHPKEFNETALLNLGMARANQVRSLLMGMGANGRQIEIKGIEDARIAIFESSLYGKFLPNAVGYEFVPFTKDNIRSQDERKRRIEKRFKNLQVFRFKNFEKEGHKIIIDDKIKSYINDLILYLSINEKAKVFCVGHSNMLDSKEKSYDLASDRARYTQDFLMSHGINPDRIRVKSAGDTHPLGEETTQYGQQINRRVDLFISYDGSTPKLYVLPPNINKTR